jgi:hypothetical protein
MNIWLSKFKCESKDHRIAFKKDLPKQTAIFGRYSLYSECSLYILLCKENSIYMYILIVILFYIIAYTYLLFIEVSVAAVEAASNRRWWAAAAGWAAAAAVGWVAVAAVWAVAAAVVGVVAVTAVVDEHDCYFCWLGELLWRWWLIHHHTHPIFSGSSVIVRCIHSFIDINRSPATKHSFTLRIKL